MIHICDDFFKDPYKVRSIALKAKYVTEKFNYPGMRSFDVPEEITEPFLTTTQPTDGFSLVEPRC